MKWVLCVAFAIRAWCSEWPSGETQLGVPADHAAFDLLGEGIEMPPVRDCGQVPVLNQGGGYAIVFPDPISLACIEYCQSAEKPLLDIGAGFGTISAAVANEGRIDVIAEDAGPENLLVLRKQVDPRSRGHLFLNRQRFPEFDLPAESLGAVSIIQVIHFLKGDEIEIGLKKIFEWLVPSGKLFIVTCSPYISVLQPFLPMYEERWARGEKWPGLVENFRALRGPQHQNVAEFIHVMDERPMRAALERAGFEVELMTFVDRRRTIPTLALDGRESIGVIAVKPR